MEVADHEHGPARLGDGELEFGAGALEQHACCAALAGDGVANLDGHLDHAAGRAGQRRLGRGQAVAVDDDRRRAAGMGDPDKLQRRIRRPYEEVRRFRGGHAERHERHPT